MMTRILALVAALAFSGSALADSTVTGGDRTIENPTSDGDLVFKVNDGGTKTEVMRIDGATSTLQISKVLQLGVCTPTNTDYTLLTTDGCSIVQFNTGTPNRTLSLGSAGGHSGRVIHVKKMNADAGFVTITGTGGIDGDTDTDRNTLYSNGAHAIIYSDGTSWRWSEYPTEEWNLSGSVPAGSNWTSGTYEMYASRKGARVTAHFIITSTITSGGAFTSYSLPCPFCSASSPGINFTASRDAGGSAVYDTAAYTSCFVRGDSGSDRLNLECVGGAAGARGLHGAASWLIP